MSMQCEHWLVRLNILTPVHVGTGDMLDPSRYAVKDGQLYEFSYATLARYLPEHAKSKLDRMLMAVTADTIGGLQRLLGESLTEIRDMADRIGWAPQGFEQTYRNKLGKPAQIEKKNGKKQYNQLEVMAAYRDGRGALAIPGSSIKGAIRTAILNGLMNAPLKARVSAQLSPKYPAPKKLAQSVEASLLSSQKVTTDPFKYFKISDACSQKLLPAGIFFGIAHKRNPPSGGETGKILPLKWHETILPGLFGVYTCDIQLEQARQREAQKGKDPTPKFPCDSLREVFKAVNAFYVPWFRKLLEDGMRYDYISRQWGQQMRQLLDGEWKRHLDAGHLCLLQIGKHGSAESKTWEEVRHIKIMRGEGTKPEYRKEATTWHFAAEREGQRKNLWPFGWVLLQSPEMPEDALSKTRACYSTENKRITDIQSQMAKAEKARLERQQQMKVQAREREAREAERHAQEQVEQERLAALSEVQREAEAFKARMEKGEGRNEGPVCALLADLKAFVRGLEKLSPEDAKAVDEVLRRAYLHVGVNLNRNKKAKAFIKEFRQRNALQ